MFVIFSPRLPEYRTIYNFFFLINPIFIKKKERKNNLWYGAMSKVAVSWVLGIILEVNLY